MAPWPPPSVPSLSGRNVLLWGTAPVLLWFATRPSVFPILFVLSLLVSVAIVTLIFANIGLSRVLDSKVGNGGGQRRKYRPPPALAFTTPASLAAHQTRLSWDASNADFRQPGLHPGSEMVSKEADRIIEWVMRDFVWKWYGELGRQNGNGNGHGGKGGTARTGAPGTADYRGGEQSFSSRGTSSGHSDTSKSPIRQDTQPPGPNPLANPAFPNAVEIIIRHSIRTLILRMSKVDLPTLIVGRILPIITDHVERFKAAEAALKGSNQDATTGSDGTSGKKSKRRMSGVAEGGAEMELFLAAAYAAVPSKLETGTEPGSSSSKSNDPRPSAPKSGLHPSLSTSSPYTLPSQQHHLRKLMDVILPLVLPQDEGASGPVKVMAREIVSCTVMTPILDMLAEPDFWNKLVDEKAGAAIREHKMVENFRSVLDAQPSSSLRASATLAHLSDVTQASDVSGSRSKFSTSAMSRQSSARGTSRAVPNRPAGDAAINIKTDAKAFEDFIKSISKISTLVEVRRLRNDVDGEIRKTRLLIGSRPVSDVINGMKVEGWLSYIERLVSARKAADRRIAELGGKPGPPEDGISPLSAAPLANPKVTLRSILTQPSSLSYFMEFMDRRQRSLPVQFWLLAEGLKDPLEEGLINISEDGLANEGLGLKGMEDAGNDSPRSSTLFASASEVQMLTDDLTMISEVYLSNKSIKANSKNLESIRRFLQDVRDVTRSASTAPGQTPPVTTKYLNQVRRNIFDVQEQVYGDMAEEDYVAFCRSDLFVKALADLSTEVAAPPPSAIPSPSIVAAPVHATAALLRDASSTPVLLQVEAAHRRPSPVRTSSHPENVRGSSNSTKKSLFDHQPPSKPITPPTSPKSALPNLAVLSGPKGTVPPLLHRTETAPPKVTVEPMFDTGLGSARSNSGNTSERDLVLLSENDGTVLVKPTSRSASGSSEGRTKKAYAPSSLEFLISSTDADERPPLFGDDEGGGDAENPAPSTPNPVAGEDDFVRVETMDAIQDALTTILASDTRHSGKAPSARSSDVSRVPTRTSTPRITSHPPSQSAHSQRFASGPPVATSEQGRDLSMSTSTPTDSTVALSKSASTGAIAQLRKNKRVFEDDDVGDSDEEEMEDRDDIDAFDLHSIRVAAPGDLNLSTEIAKLTARIDKLSSQEAVVNALMRKAELTGNQNELKILARSLDSLRRELRQTIFQKAQYEAQENENQIVPGRTQVTLPGTTVGQADGKQFVLYLIEVRQVGPDGSHVSGWIVTRRYSEFFALHAKLRDKFVAVRPLDLPGKRLVTSLTTSMVDQRRMALERYLQALVKIPAVCQSPELRSFLSQSNISLPNFDGESSASGPMAKLFPGQSVLRSVFRSVTSGMEDIFSGPSLMDAIIQGLNQQAAEFAGVSSSAERDEDLFSEATKIVAADEVVALPSKLQAAVGDEGLTFFTAPICDLFVELFELKEKNNWLRRQAIVIILQQVLGGTIERRVGQSSKIRDGVKLVLDTESIMTYLKILKDGLWPGGKFKTPEPPRTPEDKARTRHAANQKLMTLMPDLAANIIGRGNAKRGARRIFTVLQNKRLNQHLVYTIVDEVLCAVFPELQEVLRKIA